MDHSSKQVDDANGVDWCGAEPASMIASIKRALISYKSEALSGLLLLIMAANLLTAIMHKSITNDETVLIPAAYYHLAAGDFQLVFEHPPFCKILAGLPLLFIQPNEIRREQLPSQNRSERAWAYQTTFWHNNRADFERISFWARVPMIMVTLVLGVLIFAFARELFGPRTAVLSVALFSLEPTILAHGRVVQTDIPATFGYLLVFFTVYRYLLKPTWRRAVWVGIAAGIALLAKFSMLIVGPVLVAVIVALIWLAPKSRRSLGLDIGVAALALLLTLNAAYSFQRPGVTQEDQNWAATEFHAAADEVLTTIHVLSYVVPTDFVRGIFWQYSHNKKGHSAALLGMYSDTGWWYYFPVAFALKTTLPFLILSLAGVIRGIYLVINRRKWQLLFLLLPLALYTAFVMASGINIGVRYYLPAYPFLLILGGALLDSLIRAPGKSIAGMIATVVLLGWCGIEAIRVYPHYMSHMNALASSRPHWWYLSDSNVEWGDDVGDLAAYLRARGETSVHAALLGGYTTLQFYGVEYIDLLPDVEPKGSRYVAVGASFLNGSTVPEYTHEGTRRLKNERINLLDTYRHRTPEMIFGNSIYLYRMHE